MSAAARQDDVFPAPDYAVLFVCTGNICRSPTAHGVLVQQLQRAGLAARVQVDSAGTHGYHRGDPPDERSQAHAARRGYARRCGRFRWRSSGFQIRFRKFWLSMGWPAWLQKTYSENSRDAWYCAFSAS